MMKSRKGDLMKCYLCGDDAISRHGRKNLCSKHIRFEQMQSTAKNDKKYVPSIYEIEKLVPKDMKCPDCKCSIHWINDENRTQGAVLQHYRNGTLGIVCLACNTKHGMMPGDSYKDIPVGSKLCRTCKTIKPLSMFHKRKDGRIPYPMTKCKECNLDAHRQWRLNNPDKYKASNKKHNDIRNKKGA